MKALFVGQRVRLTGATEPAAKHHVGKCGRIVSRCTVYKDHFDVDCALRDANGDLLSWHANDLEPIVDAGSTPSEYSFSELMDSLRETVK